MVWYAVTAGTSTGVFKDWDDCAEATLGVSKSKYISQPTYAEAQAYYTRALTAGRVRLIPKDPPLHGDPQVQQFPHQYTPPGAFPSPADTHPFPPGANYHHQTGPYARPYAGYAPPGAYVHPPNAISYAPPALPPTAAAVAAVAATAATQGQPTPPPSPPKSTRARTSTSTSTYYTPARSTIAASAAQRDDSPSSSPETHVTQRNSLDSRSSPLSSPSPSPPSQRPSHRKPAREPTSPSPLPRGFSATTSARAYATPSHAHTKPSPRSPVPGPRLSQASSIRRSATDPALPSEPRNDTPASPGHARGPARTPASSPRGVRRAATEPAMSVGAWTPETAAQLALLRDFVADADAGAAPPLSPSPAPSARHAPSIASATESSPEARLFGPSIARRGARSGTGPSREARPAPVDPFPLSPLMFSPAQTGDSDRPSMHSTLATNVSASPEAPSRTSAGRSQRATRSTRAHHAPTSSHDLSPPLPKKQAHASIPPIADVSITRPASLASSPTSDYPADFPVSLRSPIRLAPAPDTPVRTAPAEPALPRSVTLGRGRRAGRRPLYLPVEELRSEPEDDGASAPIAVAPETAFVHTEPAAHAARSGASADQRDRPDAQAKPAVRASRPAAKVNGRDRPDAHPEPAAHPVRPVASVNQYDKPGARAEPAALAMPPAANASPPPLDDSPRQLRARSRSAERAAHPALRAASFSRRTSTGSTGSEDSFHSATSTLSSPDTEIIEVPSDDEDYQSAAWRGAPSGKGKDRADGEASTGGRTWTRTHSAPAAAFSPDSAHSSVDRSETSRLKPAASVGALPAARPAPTSPRPSAAASSPAQSSAEHESAFSSSCAESAPGSPRECTAPRSTQYTCAVDFDPSFCHHKCAHPDVEFCRRCRRPLPPLAARRTRSPSSAEATASPPPPPPAEQARRRGAQGLGGEVGSVSGDTLGMSQPAHVPNVVYPGEMDPRSPVLHSTAVPSLSASVVFHRPSPLAGLQSMLFGH